MQAGLGALGLSHAEFFQVKFIELTMSTQPLVASEPDGSPTCQFVYRAADPSTHVNVEASLPAARSPIHIMLTSNAAICAASTAWSAALRTTASCSPSVAQ